MLALGFWPFQLSFRLCVFCLSSRPCNHDRFRRLFQSVASGYLVLLATACYALYQCAGTGLSLEGAVRTVGFDGRHRGYLNLIDLACRFGGAFAN